MLTIYGVYRSRATRNIWLAGELGIPFKHVPVTQPYRSHAAPIHSRSPEFLKINPNGHVPAIDDDGLILCESLAINLYLAKKHGGPLAPANVAEDGQMSMWSLWAVTEVEGRALDVMRDPKGATAALEALKTPFAVLDAALAKTGYLVGGRFTVADINVAECVRYASAATQLFDAAPNVKKWLATCQSRPAFKEMWAKRDAEPV
jgi:glutathione S-transferase